MIQISHIRFFRNGVYALGVGLNNLEIYYYPLETIKYYRNNGLDTIDSISKDLVI